MVMETAVKGGSMITADLANGYHREVFACPGRTTDFKSAGCNWLIRNNQACLLENAAGPGQDDGMGRKKQLPEKIQGEFIHPLTGNGTANPESPEGKRTNAYRCNQCHQRFSEQPECGRLTGTGNERPDLQYARENVQAETPADSDTTKIITNAIQKH